LGYLLNIIIRLKRNFIKSFFFCPEQKKNYFHEKFFFGINKNTNNKILCGVTASNNE
jgi:hypothetical protein